MRILEDISPDLAAEEEVACNPPTVDHLLPSTRRRDGTCAVEDKTLEFKIVNEHDYEWILANSIVLAALGVSSSMLAPLSKAYSRNLPLAAA